MDTLERLNQLGLVLVVGNRHPGSAGDGELRGGFLGMLLVVDVKTVGNSQC